MNCDQFSSLIGMRCEPQPTADGTPCVAIVSPFKHFDGKGVSVYAFGHGNQVLFSDEGGTMSWLSGLGRRLDDGRSMRPLRKLAEAHDVRLGDDGYMELMVPIERAPRAFASMVSAALAIDGWARDGGGAEANAPLLVEEALMYLRALSPKADFQRDPAPLLGASGLSHRFALRQDAQLLDIIGPSRQACSAEVRKLLDVRRASANADLPITVILDDRSSKRAQVEAEASIVSGLADTWLFTDMARRSGEALV
jgi:hypothetical protein